MPPNDAIVIPGGGVRENGMLPSWVKNRLDRALEISHSATHFLLLSAGTTHRPPPLDREGFPIFESTAGGQYLVQKGIEPARILTETISYDTVGNAYFSRILHADPLGLRRLLVITSEFHMPRTELLFRWVYGLRGGRLRRYHLAFEPVPNDGIDPDTLAGRLRREQESIQNLRPLVERIQTIEAFHLWLYREHQAYAISGNSQRVSAKVAGTY